MASRSRSIRCLAAVAIATGIAGCGSSSIKGALAPSQNKRIASELSAVSDAVNSTSCGQAKTALAQLDQTLAGLPSSTNSGLVSNLKQGATTLRGLALRECRGQTTTTTTTSTSSATTPTTETTVSTQATTQTTITTQTTTSNTSTLPGTGTVTSLPSTPSTPTPTPPAANTGSGTNGAGGLAGG